MQYIITRKQTNLTYCDETKEMALDTQTARVKENVRLSHRGPSLRKASSTHPLTTACGKGLRPDLL